MSKLEFLVEYARFYGRTTAHKWRVGRMLASLGLRLMWRAVVHDLSKYRWREARWFAVTNKEMRSTKASDPGYARLREIVQVGLDEHYRANTHHPEHYPGGIDSMSFVDELEMVVDWCASAGGGVDGWIHASRGRFHHSQERAEFYEKMARSIKR